MQINISYGYLASNVTSAFYSAVNAAVSYLDSTFTNNVTLNINFSYGAILDVNNNQYQALASTSLGESYQNGVKGANYSAVRNALVAENAPGASTLGTTSADSGTLYMDSAQAKALGLTGASGALDGSVGVGNGVNWDFTTATPAANQVYLIGTLEHEITEVMGRTSYLTTPGDYSVMDLYRYSANGVHTATPNSGNAYFSVNNGATDLANWNNSTSNGADLGDWSNAGNDAFNAFGSAGVVNSVSASDVTLMRALGWTTAGTPAPTPTPTPPAHVPMTVTTQNLLVGENGNANASSLIKTITNPSNDIVATLRFMDVGPGDGHLTNGGVAVANGQWATGTFVGYVGGSTPGNQTIYVEAYDGTTGTWTAEAAATATTTWPITVNVQNVSVAENASIGVSSMITSITNPSNDSITQYQFFASSAGGGHFTINGVAEANGQWLNVSASNLASVQYVGGSTPGTQNLFVEAYDATGNVWSSNSTVAATTTAVPHVTPTLNVQNVSVSENASIAASTMIASITNPSNDNITQYNFEDSGTGGGHFTINGVTEPNGQWLNVSAANLSTIKYIGGTAAGSQTVSVEGYDATTNAWTAVKSLTATTTAPHIAPTVNVQNVSVSENASVAGSSLITSVTNPSGDNITQYGFLDSGTGGGHFTINGVTEANGQWQDVTAANLSSIQYVGGTAAGSQTLSVEAYDATTGTWTAASSLTATTTAPHIAPTVNVQNVSVAANASVAGSSLIASITNPSGDTITQYGFLDSGTGGGHFTINGVNEANGQWQDVTAANLATIKYVGGTTAGSQTLSVEAYDATTGTWTAASSLTATTTALHIAPTVNVQNVTVVENTAMAASNLITSVTNPSGDNITQYAFMDSGAAGHGHFTINGVTEPLGQWLDVSASNLSSVQYVGGTTAGSQTLSVEAYDATTGTWTAASSLTATSAAPFLKPIAVAAPAVWGVAGASAQAGDLADQHGTSVDVTAVSNFLAGTASGADTFNFSASAWGSAGSNPQGGINHGLTAGDLASHPGDGSSGANAVLASVVPGSTVGANADIIELSKGSFADANAVATALHSNFAFNFGASLANHDDSHVLFAYSDLNGATRIADVEFSNNSGVATSNTALLTEHATDVFAFANVSMDHLAASNFHLLI